MGRGLRAMLVAAMGVMLLAVAGGVAWADVFSVSGVRVDVRATTATQAREQALRQGQVEAFRRMISVIVSDGDQAWLADPSAEEIETMVGDLSVADERASATRYIATLTVHFDPARVNAYLCGRGVSVVKASDERVILLGVYRETPDAAPQLWEETNTWRPLLTNAAVARGLFPVVVPLGDIEDMAQASAEKALALDAAGLDSLMIRYGADAAVVAEAVMKPGRGASLILKDYPRAVPSSFARLELPIVDDPDAALGDLAAHVVLAVAARAAKPQTGSMMIGDLGQLAILVPVQGLADWVRVDRTLRALPGVRGVSLRASRSDLVQATVQYAGDPEALWQVMTRVGLAAMQRDGYWEVVPGSEPATSLPR